MSTQVIDGSYRFEYLPTGWEVLQRAAAQRTPNLFLCGGFGSSKTRTICEIGFEFGLIYPNVEIGYFRKTRTAIKATTYRDFLRDTMPQEYILDHDKTELKIMMKKTRAEYCFFGIDNYERKGSLRFDIILVDEATELDEDDIVMLQGRLRGKILRVPFILHAGNSGAPGAPLHLHFVQNAKRKAMSKEEIEYYTSYLETGDKVNKNQTRFNELDLQIRDKQLQDPDFAYFVATSYENIHNPPAYFARLDKWKGTPYYNRFVLAQWEAFEGLVYGSFWNRDDHEIDPFEIPFDWPKKLIVDFGFTLQHPLVFLWMTKNPITGIKYVYRQFYMTGLLQRYADKECKDITESCNEKILEIVADHDAEARAQVEKDFGMSVTPAIKDVKAGIQSVSERMLPRITDKMRGLYVFNDKWSTLKGFQYGLVRKDILLQENNYPTCLQEEVPKYIWGKDDLPKPIYDHALDCVRYEEQTERWGDNQNTFGQVLATSTGTRSRR